MFRWLGLSALCFSAVASASDWQPVGRTAAGLPVFVEVSSMKMNGSKVIYWQKTLDAKAKEERWARYEMDCAADTATILSLMVREPSGAIREMYQTPDYKREAMPIPPDSLADAIEKFICPKM